MGIISDTHDNVEVVRRAGALFRERGVGLVIHAGDWVAPFMAARLRRAVGEGVRIVGVWGNNEGERVHFVRVAAEHGVEVMGDAFSMALDGLRVGVYHGTSQLLLDAMVRSGMFDVVVYGHTHRVDVRVVGDVLVVNPGEACGCVTGKSTVALLDTATRKVEVVEV